MVIIFFVNKDIIRCSLIRRFIFLLFLIYFYTSTSVFLQLFHSCAPAFFLHPLFLVYAVDPMTIKALIGLDAIKGEQPTHLLEGERRVFLLLK